MDEHKSERVKARDQTFPVFGVVIPRVWVLCLKCVPWHILIRQQVYIQVQYTIVNFAYSWDKKQVDRSVAPWQKKVYPVKFYWSASSTL